jgi:chemotaxis protein histidine kinase CheA
LSHAEKKAVEIELAEVERMDVVEANYRGFINIFGTLHKVFHKLRGSARLQGAEKFEEVTRKIEDSLEFAEDSLEKKSPADIQALSKKWKTALEFVDQMSLSIAENGDESKFLGEGGKSNEMESILHEVNNLMKGNNAAGGAA